MDTGPFFEAGWALRYPGDPTMTSNGKRKASRQARGYGASHIARRANLAPIVATGRTRCVRCNHLIEAGQPWHLDHDDDRRTYLGPAHAHCNLSAAAVKRNGKRIPTRRWSRVWFEPIPPGTIVNVDGQTIQC